MGEGTLWIERYISLLIGKVRAPWSLLTLKLNILYLLNVTTDYNVKSSKIIKIQLNNPAYT